MTWRAAAAAPGVAQPRVGLVQPGSTTGNLVPRLRPAALGIAELDAAVAHVTYAGTHAATVELRRRGEAGVVALIARVAS